MHEGPLAASFRDPSGFVFNHEGVLYRQVNQVYAGHYAELVGTGLCSRLQEAGLLIRHEEVDPPVAPDAAHHLTLRPDPVAFVSFPYEWCFGQLREAALLTLRIQREALAAGMTLKDASAYNVQFRGGEPVFIDTLSFERREEGAPWVAYGQFCRHFLAPLVLMSLSDVRLGRLLALHVDGVPLDLASALLPRRAWLRPALFAHLWLHARYQRRHASDADPEVARRRSLSRKQLENLVASLEGAVRRLEWDPQGTEWADYYDGDSYGDEGFAAKRDRVAAHLDAIAPETVWDLGANTGVFSRIAAERCDRVVSFDVDPACVERNFRQAREEGDKQILPLLLDLTNPSPGIGWANRERPPIFERGRPDAILALALIHHLAISNNVPLTRVSRFLADATDHLVIEFVPKADPKVKVLLASRADVFPDYTQEGFEAAFAPDWEVLDAAALSGSERTLYRMRRRR